MTDMSYFWDCFWGIDNHTDRAITNSPDVR